MKQNKELLVRLLKKEHINVPERKELGFFENKKIKYKDMKKQLICLLEESEWFPKELDIDQNQVIEEGVFIQRRNNNCFICVVQRTDPGNPDQLAERTEKQFKTSKEAAEFYLKWELNLPGDLDGWEIR